MIMYKNGEYQGIAFEDIYAGMYYPAVSLYKAATVRNGFYLAYTVRIAATELLCQGTDNLLLIKGAVFVYLPYIFFFSQSGILKLQLTRCLLKLLRI